VTIAVHFRDAVNDGRKAQAIVDGIWQISQKPISVDKDNAVTLGKNRDVSMFPGIGLKTADNDSLRFFIYKQEDI
jgi:hypothetical protein